MAKKILLKEILIENVKDLRDKLPKGSKFCAVIKSNAYGHGVKEVAKTIESLVDYFAVANCLEARELDGVVAKPILVLCTNFEDIIANNVELAIYDLNQVNNLKKYDSHFDVHIAIDSGMNRLGLKTKKDLNKILKECKKAKNITIKGLFSHISDVDNIDRCNEQLKNFNKLAPKGYCKHIASSNFIKLGDDFAFDMVRFGLAMYCGKQDSMRVTANILQIKFVKKGEYIGYGSKVKASNNMRVGVLDIGYALGLMRANVGGDVLVYDNRCKILNVCMSLTLIDLNNIKCKVGDEVVVLGKGNKNAISSQEIASRCGTIPYEVLTNFSKLE